MSDDLPPGATSLEFDPNTGGTPVGIVTDPAVPIDPNAPEPEAEPDGTITGSGGVKFVPLQAVIAERTARKEAEKALKAKDEEFAPFKQKAQKYDEAEQYLHQVRPVIDKVMARPDLLKLADQPPAEAPGPLTATEAAEYAKNFDLYKPDNTLDVDRAQRIVKFHEVMNQRTVSQALQPFQQQTAVTQAREMRQRLTQVKDAPSAASIDKVFASLPPELAALPEVANLVLYVAKGMDAMNGTVTPPPVVPTESVGGSPQRTEHAITDLDRRFMEAGGISKKAYEEAAAKFKPGQFNSLE